MTEPHAGGPLEGVRVLECAGDIAGPYCAKLLRDAGADVVKLEPPAGDPLRAWGSGALFAFLNAGKRSVVEPGAAEASPLWATADIVILDRPRNEAAPAVSVSITPFGSDGPWARRAATEFTLQAACGSTGNRGVLERPPVYAGGRLGEWIAGTFAAVGALAAWWGGCPEHVDVSMLECMTVSMNTYTSVFASFLGWPEPKGPVRTIEIPSIEPTADGYVGFCTITGQQFQDFLLLIERPDLLDDRHLATAQGRSTRRHEMSEIIRAWTLRHTTAEVIEQATAMRIPVAPVGDGRSVVEFDHFVERATFVDNPDGFVQPRVPYRIGELPRPAPGPTPALGEGGDGWLAPGATHTPPSPHGSPLAGLRVVDLTAFWAGPAATEMLASLGADVVKIESTVRPDGMRFSATKPPGVDEWWEWGPIFHAANAGKRGITLDLNRPEGVALLLRLVEHADAIVENFTPRVVDNFGLSWEALSAVNPRLVMVRMPAFGLDGPWRDRTGFAQTMEQITGMGAVTGYPDGPPLIPRGACDPLAGMHAVFALLLALRQREHDGRGRLVEATLVEAALNAAAEPIVEYAKSGVLIGRRGNRGPVASPQGVYECREPETWVALAAATPAHWEALRTLAGLAVQTPPVHADAPDAETVDGELATWARAHTAAEAVDALLDAGVPAAVVVNPADVADNPQMRHRGFFERVVHPVTGAHDIPTVPFRFSSRGASGWLRHATPTLGQHNAEILGGELGVDDETLEALHATGVIGARPAGL